ncbi:hypothetical protein FQR65_LT11133 [Abscondita terminalis]|nr:hypothetical protein FQR65_LT11133 [Abscondita terminalis]
MKFLRSLLIISSIVFYVYGDNVEISLRNAEPNCVCNNTIGCIRKCCNPDNIIPGYELNCTHVGVDNFRINISTEFGDEIPKMCYKYGVMKCEKSFYRLDPLAYEEDQFEIRFDGKLWTTNLQDLYDSDGYCLENFEDIGMSAYVCTLPELIQSGSVYAVGMIVSLPFLFVTFFVHLLLPVKSIHTKCLMGFVLSLFFAYATLITLEYYKDFDRIICFIIGMICVFSFMSSFLWTNAMSIDIWLTFSGRTRGYGRSRKKAEMKRFWFYFTYAYGLGLVQVIIIVMLTIFGDDVGWYNPLFAKSKCWFQENMGLLLYFYGPLMTIIIVNVVFFGLTAWRIRQTQKDTAVLRQGENKSNSDDEQRQNNIQIRVTLC